MERINKKQKNVLRFETCLGAKDVIKFVNDNNIKIISITKENSMVGCVGYIVFYYNLGIK